MNKSALSAVFCQPRHWNMSSEPMDVVPAGDSIARHFFPVEVNRIRTKNTADIVSTSHRCECEIECEGEDKPIMFSAQLGNQCGCNTRMFAGGAGMSAASWVSNPDKFPGTARQSASLKLLQRLQGRTLCFVGDSVDKRATPLTPPAGSCR